MTHDNHNNDAPLPEALRFELRALRRDVPPATDLWPSIAQRIAATPQAPAKPVASPLRRLAPLAAAASLALVMVIAWQMRPGPAPSRAVAATDPNGQLIAKEADAMTREYQAALKVINASTGTTAPPTLRELQVLDRSAAQIRTALTRSPDARFLLDRLQHTYTRRLEITQRIAIQDTLAS